VTWAELIRKLQPHGFVALKTGEGSHRQCWNPTSKQIMTVTVHTKKEVGAGLANRILKAAGIKGTKGSS
jgi:predicted RNA binding protein YcfA (HicA-like mRNA interferase family)